MKNKLRFTRSLALVAFVIFIMMPGRGWGQTNPTTGALPFSYNGSTSLPTTIAIHRFGTSAGAIPTTRTTSDGTGDLPVAGASTSGGYILEGTSGVDGISMLASSSQSAGAIIAEVSTTGKTNIIASWVAWTILDQASYTNSIALQYRAGESGTWIDVDNPSSSIYTTSTTGRSNGVSYTQNLPVGAENKAIIQLRWIYWISAGSSGSRDRLGIDNLSITGTTATPIIALSSPSQIGAGTVNQSATNIILSQFEAAVSTANATLNSLSFTSAGTYISSDISNFKLWYNTSNTISGATQVGSSITSLLGGGSHTFSSLTQAINSGSTGYFFITCDIAASPTTGNTVYVAADPALAFAAGTPTGSISVGGSQTIIVIVPDIAISSTNPAVTAGNITQGTINNVIYSFDNVVTTYNATLSGLQVTTSGTFVAADLTNLKAWYSLDATFSAVTDVLLSTKTTSLGAGTQVFPSWTNQVIASGATGYIFITTDIPCSATAGGTITVSAVTTSDVTFLTGNKTGTTYAGGAQTLFEATPVNASALGATNGNTQSIITWTPPTGCYDEIMIVAKASSLVTATPSGNGSSYTPNLAFGTGGSGTNLPADEYCIYKGTTSPQTMTGITNGTTYNIKVFSRKGSTWSAGVATTASPVSVTASTDYFRSLATGNWGTNATWESSPNGLDGSWITATATPSSAANTITIRNGHTVTVAVSVTIDQVVIDASGQVTVNASQILTIANGVGTDLAISGTIVNNGSVTLQGTTSTNVSGTFTNAGTLTMSTVTTALVVSGVFNANTGGSILNASAGPISFTGTAQYNHVIAVGVIPTATWGATTTCNVTGMVGTAPTGLGQTFGNFTWNCSSQTAFCNVNNPLFSTSGALTIASTGSGSGFSLANNNTTSSYTYSFNSINVTGGVFQLLFRSGTSSTYPTYVNITGDVSVSNSAEIQFGSAGGVVTGGNYYCSAMYIGGNLNVGNSAKFYCKSTSLYGLVVFTGSSPTYTNANSVVNNSTNNYQIDYVVSANTALTLNSNFSIWSSTSSAFDALYIAGSLNTGSTYIVNPSTGSNGDFELLDNSSTPLTFTRTSGSQTITAGDNSIIFPGMEVSGTGITANTYVIDFISTTDVILSKPATASGTSALTFTSNGKIYTGNSNGLQSTGTSGAVQVATRTLSSTANFVYNGTSDQVTGTLLTAAKNIDLANTTGKVSLSSSIAVSGTVTVPTSNKLGVSTYAITGAGNFNLQSGGTLYTANTAGINGSIGLAGTKTFDAAANYVFNGAADQVTGALLTAANNIDLANTAGKVSLSGNVAISGILNVPSGNKFGASTYTASGAGTFNLQSGGTLFTANASGIDGSITTTTKTLDAAATYVFNGSSPQVTGALLPATVNNLTIDNATGVKLSNSALTVTSTMLINSGKLFTLESTKQLTVGTLTNTSSADLVIKSDASGTGSLITSSSPNATVERYLVKYDALGDNMYHFISSPVSAQVIRQEFVTNTPTANQDFYSFSETTNEWINSRATGNIWNTSFENNFAVGKGYMVAYSADVTKNFTGTLNAGTQTITCTNTTGKGEGWNLLGNPFASALDWNAVTRGDGMDDALYYYDNTAKNYRYFIHLAGETVALGSGQQYIPAMQGFMVHAKSTGTKTVTISNAARTHSGQGVFYKSTNSVPGSLSLKVSANGYEDEAFIHFNQNATTAFDGKYDAFKLKSYSTNVPSIYTVASDGNQLAINGLPEVEENSQIPVYFVAGKDGQYTLTANLQNLPEAHVYLVDNKLSKTQNLSDNPVYTFAASTTDQPNRFKLTFNSVGINEPAGAEPLHVYMIGTNLNIVGVANTNAEIRVTNMIGQVVLRGNTNGNTQTVLNTNKLQNGVYVVSLISGSKVVSTKIVVSR